MKLTKHIVFILFFLALSGELIFESFNVKLKPLKGAFKTIEKPKYTMDNWFDGTFQENVIKHYEQYLYLHPSLIRIRNELAYSCFNEIYVNGCAIGKDNYLFETGYIDSYMGKYFVGDAVIKEKTRKLAFVQSELKKKNIDLLFVIAPTKASYMPEYIPDTYDLSKRGKTDYEGYVSEFEKQNINYIDISKLFDKLKPVVKYPLFTRTGIHWSGYGCTIAFDSIAKRMENMRNISFANYKYNGGEVSTNPRGGDDDLGKAMNLIDSIHEYPMYYPNIVFGKDTTKPKPDVLLVGDSFIWSWVNFYEYIPNLFTDNSAFWFYNQELAYTKHPIALYFPLDKKTLAEQTLHRDYILIVNNRWALNKAGDDFIEQMYDLLGGGSLVQ